MIDCHCHLEQKEYDGRLDDLILEWKKELKFVISSCAHIQDLEKTIEIEKKFKPFVKICIGLHPEFIKEIKEEDIKKVINFVKEYKDKIVAIGEVGLDYHWISEQEWRKKQKLLFLRFIKLAKELDLPLVIHSWDATNDAIDILEKEEMKGKRVLFHLLQDKSQVSRIIENGWFISIGPSILKSKDIKKIARDIPLQRILLETDSPWFAQKPEQEFGIPLNVKLACEKIAEIKKMKFEEVEKQTDLNAIEFFKLR